MAVKPGTIPDDVFVETWRREGNGPRTAKALGISERWAHTKRKQLSARGYDLPTRPEIGYERRVPDEYRVSQWTFPREKKLEIDTGAVVVFSDAHYWPGEPSVAHRALLAVIKAVKPRVIINNGDAFDGGGIGRHDPFGQNLKPNVKEEMDACVERLGEVEQAAPKGCELLWNIGNHDQRFERNIVTKIPDYATLIGMRLGDHFPSWDMYWSTSINRGGKDPVMVLHNYANGIHAAYNNTMKSGFSMVTGHTHQLEVKPYVDYRGRRYGVQTGTLQDLDHPAFEYQQNRPSLACPGFAVLNFGDGALHYPELCQVIDGKAWFRGEAVA